MSRKKKAAPKPNNQDGHWLKILLEQLGPKLGWSLVGGGLLLALIVLLTWPKYSGKYQDKLQEGQAYLNHGLYPQAKASFQDASTLFPLRQLKLAVERLQGALRLLGDKGLMSKPDNQLPWQYKAGLDEKGQQILIHLSTVEEKRCYVYLSLAASVYLDGGDMQQARRYWQYAQQASAEAEIKDLAGYDLRRLAKAQPAWADKIRAFVAEFRHG